MSLPILKHELHRIIHVIHFAQCFGPWKTIHKYYQLSVLFLLALIFCYALSSSSVALKSAYYSSIRSLSFSINLFLWHALLFSFPLTNIFRCRSDFTYLKSMFWVTRPPLSSQCLNPFTTLCFPDCRTCKYSANNIALGLYSLHVFHC